MAKPHVVFIHLDLGIGGAESLVLNLAKATLPTNFPNEDSDVFPSSEDTMQCGTISIYTTHCSPTHCYDEVRPPDGYLSPFVHVRGSWIPRQLSVYALKLGGTALFSAIRMMYLTYCAVKENPKASVFVLDVLPTGVPYLAEYVNVNAGVLFYCHFPDKLLTRDTVNGEEGSTGESQIARDNFSLLQFLLVIFKLLKRIYRWMLDTTEEWTMSYSDLIVVNSNFTRKEVEKVFPSLFYPRSRAEFDDVASEENDLVENDDSPENETGYGERVKVLYPAIESSLSRERKRLSNSSEKQGKISADSPIDSDERIEEERRHRGPIVSLNRFERKKNIGLLLHAYDLLLERTASGKLGTVLPPLIIAGGYDPRNIENVEHLHELQIIADEILLRHNLPPSTVQKPTKTKSVLALENDENGNPTTCLFPELQDASISFHPSVSNAKRNELLSSASVLCYTPHREHFGIVPLEAMDAGVPVVAVRSGGPMETVVDGVTGLLVDYSGAESIFAMGGDCPHRSNSTVDGFADAIESILSDPKKAQKMGQSGRERIDKVFGMETFRRQWWKLLVEAQRRGSTRHNANLNISYPRISLSVARFVFEMLLVTLFALCLTWVLGKAGLLEDGLGVLATAKVVYRRFFGGEEL